MSIEVMVNGIPGKMGIAVAEAVLRRGWTLLPYSLCGSKSGGSTLKVGDIDVKLLSPTERVTQIADIKQKHPNMLTVDYTHPSAVNSNAAFYIQHHLPFVMGTTGGDRDLLFTGVKDAKLPCVIAPNMGKQIVAFQAMMEYMAKEFPGVFSGYSLSVEESHQKTKADTSGTAKAVVASFQKMGLDFGEKDIVQHRTEEASSEIMKVPSEYQNGHAYHTYHLASEDQTVNFEFQHNVCGRDFYAEGTVDAVGFLADKISKGEGNDCFDMIDVLRSGKMEF